MFGAFYFLKYNVITVVEISNLYKIFMHKVPDLPYDYDALEPHIDQKTMRIHHDKHHQGYVDKLNSALEGHDNLQEKSVKELLSNLDSVPEDIRVDVRRGGGGHYNHSLFWPSMSPDGGGQPEGDLAKAIDNSFGSFENFKEEFSSAAGGVFGSGWGWLVLDSGELKVVQSKNQNNPISDGMEPLLGLDVWEHAYYISYQNKRGSYIDAFWNVVNWSKVEERFEQAK